jgi:hypothetical protein
MHNVSNYFANQAVPDCRQNPQLSVSIPSGVRALVSIRANAAAQVTISTWIVCLFCIKLQAAENSPL